MSKETEIAVYCRIGDITGLNKASKKIHQCQTSAWMQEGDNGGKVRVRKETVEGVTTYTLAVKSKGDSNLQKKEAESIIEDGEAIYSSIASLSGKYVEKTRYIYEIDSVVLEVKDKEKNVIGDIPAPVYELDVFITEAGQFHEWAKIDIEVDAVLEYLDEHYPEVEDINLEIKVSHLPFKPTDYFVYPPLTGEDSEKKAFVNNLWDNEYSKTYHQFETSGD